MQVARNDLHLQMGGVWQSRLKRRYQLVIRLKANECYQKLLCSLSSYINLLNLLNLQGLHNQLLAPGRFQTSSPWSRPLTNSKLKEVLVLVLVFDQSFGQLFGQLVAIRPLLDELLALSQSDCSRMSCLTLVAWSVDSSWLFACVNRLAYWFFCIAILNCLWLHQAVVCWVCQAIVRNFGQSMVWLVGRLLVRSVDWFNRSWHRPRPWSRPQWVDAFDIVLAIIFLSGSRRNHSPEQSHIHIGPPPGSPTHIARLFR